MTTQQRKMPDVYEAQKFLGEFLGLSVSENKPDIVFLLKSNGVNVSEGSSQKEVLTASYIALAKSNRFRKDLAQYIKSAHDQEKDKFKNAEGFSNLVDDDGNGVDDVTGKTLTKAEIRKLTGTKTKVGTLLQKVGTQENIEALINTGIGIVSQKLSAKADQKSLETAAALSAAKSAEYAAKAKADEAAAARRKWVIPVVIGGVVLIGVAVYLGMKKRKK